MDIPNKEKKKYSVSDSVWIAAAVMSYEKYFFESARNITDYHFKQKDIRKRAEEINGIPVDLSITRELVCGDNEKHTHSYLRAVEDCRRLSFPTEFQGNNEQPDNLNKEDIIPTSLGNISIQQLLDFVNTEYAEMSSQVIKTEIDYIGVLNYLRDNSDQPYSNPEENSLSEEERKRLLDLKEKSQIAVGEMKKMAGTFGKIYGLDKCMPMSWLEGSNTKTRKYLWAQLKYSKYSDNPVSVSIFVEKSGSNTTKYRICLELKNDRANTSVMEKFHSFLDIPLDNSAGLVYVDGSNELEYPTVLNESQDVIKKKVSDGTLKKVQISKYIERIPDETNKYYHSEMTKAIEAIIPYYNHVLGEKSEEYRPSLEEYEPMITVEKWIELLNDPSVTLNKTLRMLMTMVEYGGESTCENLAELQGGTADDYNDLVLKFCDRVHEVTKCPLYKDGSKEKVYTIAFVERKIMEKGHDRYSWKLRDELKAALESDMINETRIEPSNKFKDGLKNVQYDNNMILYGPPGTGKTYNTAIYAVAICKGIDIETVKEMSYEDIMAEYEKLKKAGRIAFTTFHQSYGYEEFVEGIKPVVDQTKKEISYAIEPGVFKKFCDSAGTVKSDGTCISINNQAQIWKLTIKNGDMNSIKHECFTEGNVRMGFSYDAPDARAFVADVEIGDIILSFKTRRTIDGIAVVTGDIEELESKDTYKLSRKVTWLAKNIDKDITDINAGKLLHRITFAKVPNMKSMDVLKMVLEPYVFIIDEINRGNISKIFGELITLIEKTKRAGMVEAVSAILPYSGESFSVPANVYILGTMNTADRSIALLDTALRRRFQFKEMMPDTSILIKIGADKINKDGIELNVAEMLETINKRIEYLFDREHTIGHAFFTELKDEPTVEKLASIFKNSVIPLLQEYFYDDYSKIMFVLGDNGKENDHHKFIMAKEIKHDLIFRGDTSGIDIPDYAYEIQDEALYDIMSYKEITG